MKARNIFYLIVINILFSFWTGCSDPDTNNNIQAQPSTDTTVSATSTSAPLDEDRYQKLGGCTQLDLDHTSKCNLTKGYYITVQPIRDSADLAFLVQYLAGALFRSAKKEADCDHPIMTQVSIYASQSDYKTDKADYLSLCTITPTHYEGQVYVNMLKVYKIKKGHAH